MSRITTGNVRSGPDRPLYQPKSAVSPAASPHSAAASSPFASTPAAQVTLHQAAPPGRTQALTNQLDEKLTSRLTQIRQNIGNGSARSGIALDVSA